MLTNPVCKVGLIIHTAALTSVFLEGSEGQNIIHVYAKRSVNVIDQGLDIILLRGLVEGDDGESRFLAAVALEDGLVVLDGCAAVTRSSDDDMGTSRPLRISTPIDPFPTSVSRAFPSLNEVLEAAISEDARR